MSNVVHKVTAFVTRKTSNGRQLLLFKHPTAGIQLPAGSVDEGELIETAVLPLTPKPTLVSGQDKWLEFVYGRLIE